MAAFSRLQLAAALIEYDNDPASPDQPYRSAQESAIFAHVRQANTGVRAPARRSTDYLGVDLPSDHGRSPSPRDPYVRAQSSLSGMLVNPFGGTVEDDMDGGEEPHPAEPEPELEVDLASWGLDGFIPKDKDKARVKKKGKGKAREVEFPNPHDQRARAQSIDLGRFGAGGAFLDSARTPSSDNRIHARAQSVSAALELGRGTSPLPIVAQRPMSSHAAIQSLPVTPPLHSVPFPSQSVRSVSPGPQLEASSPRRSHGRTYSTASWGSKAMLNDIQESERNPFELDAPPPERTSRFDPKAARSRTASIGSMGSRALLDDFADDGENGTSLRPASPSQSTRLDTKARSRVMSTASMGSRMMLDDGMSVMTGAPYRQERPMSTLEMLRPKVLVMPSPLQGQPEAKPAPPSYTVRDGFQLTLSSDGTPLPPGVRASGSSTNLLQPSASVPIASNSFIPNPRSTLTASQLLFRNQLMVDGQRDVAYADIDRGLQRATEDGQQIFMPEDEEPVRPVSVVVDELVAKPAGKLFGKSLVDELEERKATMRSKQRVFYGDSRPSMMSRAQTRSSTLIDPATLTQRPGAADGALERRNSYGPKPLLNIEDGPLPPPRRPGLGQTGSSRSVFGVDTLWEKEMAKLKEIEALEAAARKEEEAMEQAAAVKRGKKKGKGKAADVIPLPGPSSPMPLSDSPLPSPSAEPRVSIAPPVLPDIPRNITRGPPPPAVEDESDSGSDSTDDSARKADAPQWFAGASDDEHGGGPVRTTGTGLRYPHGRGLPMPQPADDDSEEDVPLVATVSRAMQRATRLGLQPGGGDDSDEDKPLSRVLQKKKSTAGTLDIDFDKAISPSSPGPQLASPGAINSDDEDDKPLGLRASRVLPPSSAAGGDGSDDEDEKPLGLHPQQQMRSMYASQQQQQQQMQFAQQMAMQQQMQAQAAHASMMFSNPSMMGSGFFAPQPTPGMMAAPMMVPMMPPPATGSPPPAQDPAKFNRVDQWRRGVPVDGS